MKRRALGALTFCLSLMASSAGATTIEAMDLESLTHGADRILTGEVAQVQSRWEGTLIVSEVEVTVARCLVGPCDSTVTLKVVGGQVGDLVMMADGMARFSPGEEVLLFLDQLAPTREASWRTRGMAQGKFTIKRASGEAWVERDLHSLELVGRDAAPALSLEGMKLDAMVTGVRRAGASR